MAEQHEEVAAQFADMAPCIEGPVILGGRMMTLRHHETNTVSNYLKLVTNKGDFHFTLPLDATDCLHEVITLGRQQGRDLEKN